MTTYPRITKGVMVKGVYDMGTRDGICVCVSITDCSAKLVHLFNRRWDDKEVVVRALDRGFNISPNSEGLKLVGWFDGQLIEAASTVFTRHDTSKHEVVLIPMPGGNPASKRRRRTPKVDVITDGGHASDNGTSSVAEEVERSTRSAIEAAVFHKDKAASS